MMKYKRTAFAEDFNRLLFLPLILMVAMFNLQCTSYQTPEGDPNNDGLVLPEGFEALVVAEGVGPARHIAVNDNGDLYVKLRQGGNLGLRDTTGDGKADIIEQFGDYEDEGSLASGMRIHNGYLYFSSVRSVYRYKLIPGKLVPDSEIELVMTDDHAHGVDHWHISKPIAFDGKGNMYIPFGSPSNNCQVINRVLAATPGAPGLDPCPELIDHAGIWRFDENKLGQTQKDGELYATGIRSAVAMAWNRTDDALYTAVHGRDNMYTLFPDKFSSWQNAVLPAEEFMKVTKGSDFGWPYYYYDQMVGKRMLSPEYGGDGKESGEGHKYDQPIMAFPGHWAPNDLLFYEGDQFPEHYKNGAFIAFHGSNNRAPYPQAGYFLCFVPFRDGVPTGEWEVFADGFVGEEPLVTTSDAKYRPMGLAVGPDGSLYLSDSQEGRIWRILFNGNKQTFGEQQLAPMEDRKKLVHIRTPDSINDDLDKGVQLSKGLTVYNTYCRSCHQADGLGDNNHFPALAGSGKVVGDKQVLIDIILRGVEQPEGLGQTSLMPPHQFLTDEYIAEVATYVRQHFGNNASTITPEEVKKVRGVAD